MLVFVLLASLVGAAGCDVFSPRTPEPPLEAAGTYEQPDTPEQVIANLQAAVAELNTLNYRRSLAEDLTFTPTATAEARDPVWTGWGLAEEERYFSTLAAAARTGTGHRLDLNDRTLTLIDADRQVLDATYLLIVNHTRADAPTTVQGRLQWVLVRGTDGLWRLREWVDRELGSNPSWSDLKAAFVQ
ncbi:MAG: hypothetical protein D6683_12780 [Actinomyces sp.]|nr:MAG: hypothetical protein D6683_12780 [Actinomyces sp.]